MLRAISGWLPTRRQRYSRKLRTGARVGLARAAFVSSMRQRNWGVIRFNQRYPIQLKTIALSRAGRVSGIKAHTATRPSVAAAVNPKKAIGLPKWSLKYPA